MFILKGFKSSVLEVRIAQDDTDWNGADGCAGTNSVVRWEASRTWEMVAPEYRKVKYFTWKGRIQGLNGRNRGANGGGQAFKGQNKQKERTEPAKDSATLARTARMGHAKTKCGHKERPPASRLAGDCASHKFIASRANGGLGCAS